MLLKPGHIYDVDGSLYEVTSEHHGSPLSWGLSKVEGDGPRRLRLSVTEAGERATRWGIALGSPRSK